MGGQGFIPEDGEGGLVEGNREANRHREETQYEHGNAAPRAGMQGPQGARGGAREAGDHQGEIDDHGIATNQERDRPKGVIEKAEGDMKDRGGQAGPGVAGSGVHGMQDDVNRPVRDAREEKKIFLAGAYAAFASGSQPRGYGHNSLSGALLPSSPCTYTWCRVICEGDRSPMLRTRIISSRRSASA